MLKPAQNEAWIKLGNFGAILTVLFHWQVATQIHSIPYSACHPFITIRKKEVQSLGSVSLVVGHDQVWQKFHKPVKPLVKHMYHRQER